MSEEQVPVAVQGEPTIQPSMSPEELSEKREAATRVENLRKLSVLAGAPLTRTIVMDDGSKLEVIVKRVKVGKIPPLIEAAGPLMGLLMDKSKGRNNFDIEQMFLFHSAACLDVLAVLTNQPRSVIDELDLDDAMMLMADAAELNIDFFVQRILPLLYGGVQKLVDMAQKGKLDLSSLAGKTLSKP
jgi:hypothetical protein